MRLSCCAYSYRDLLTSGEMTLFGFLKTVREIGCEAAELTSYYFPSTDRAFLAEVKRSAHKEGVLISGTAVGSDFAQPDAAKRAEHVKMTKEWVDHSVMLGAPTLRVFAGGVRVGQSEEDAFNMVVECLAECTAYASDWGVQLALENHGGLTATAAGTLRIREAVGSPALGLNLDFGNFKSDIYAQFEACAPYAVATHAKPTVHAGDTAITVDYHTVRTIMEAVGYRGFIAIEYEEKEPAALGTPRFAKELREALAQQ